METVMLKPVPGFCVKSRAINDAQVHLTAFDQPHSVHVQKGLKIFVNVAWDPNVPPPPIGSDDTIHRAMQGLDNSDQAWFVPIVLSDARQDSDKAGQSAIVFDCVLNSSIKSRTLRDPDFKNFIIELAFQRIEAQTPLVLSRQIGTPNIASKGKPRSRRVSIPTTLSPTNHPNRQVPPSLVQEIADRLSNIPEEASPKGIPKKPLAPSTSDPRVPIWSWSQQGSHIRIVFDVPGVTHALIPGCTLDVEPRRVLLHVPALYDLDINLEYLDAELVSIFGKNDTAEAALKLKRMRSFDVNNARAEWRVADGAIVLLV